MICVVRNANLCIAIVIGSLLLSCGGEKETSEEIIRPVRYEPVFSTGGSRTRIFSGVAKAGIESKLSFRVPGTIKNIRIKVGDTVSQGDLLAELDDVDYRLGVRKGEAALEQAKAQLRNATAQYDRIRLLYENDNTSQATLDATLSAHESAQASVSAFEQTLELANLQLEYTRLIAPIGGAIASVNAEENENVNAGETLALLSAGSQIEVDVFIPEKLISQIREGSPVAVIFDAVKGEEFPGLITEVGITPIGGSSGYPVTVKLGKDIENVRAGMAAEVTFTFESKDNRTVIMVPSHAIKEDRDGRFVYVAESAEEGMATIIRKNVTVGDFAGDDIEIFEGLNDGDMVVTAGMSKITEGMTVKLLVQKEN
ncbi:efflux RND transporter periplasmic adaptor subunit [Candidatus Latescibacterota bacterium]